MIRFLDLRKITDSFKPELEEAVSRVVNAGIYIRGSEVEAFEKAFAAFTGTTHCVGVGNGYDALRLIFRAWIVSGDMKEGDEVIVPANTYVASILAVSENRLTPVFVEPEAGTFTLDPALIEERITPRTRAVLVVHLYGRNGMRAAFLDLCNKYHLKLVEDNAQAAGCMWDQARTGSIGHAAAHSFFPTKNLGALGDGGAVTTNDGALAQAVRALGNYGSEKRGVHHLQGVNSRLDELQAAILNLKLRRLDADNARRRRAAEFYRRHIHHPAILLPEAPEDEAEHVWHLFVVRTSRRDALLQHLMTHGIEALVHYPIAPHKQTAYAAFNHLNLPLTEQIHRQVLSLPLSPVIEEHELAVVAEALNRYRI